MKGRWPLEKARPIMMNHKPAQTPVGVVTGAMRSDQRIEVTALGELPTAVVNMQSTVFIGNRSTRRYGDFLLTLRGYGEKYRL